MAMTGPHRLLILGADDGVAVAIGARLIAEGLCVAAEDALDAVLVDAMDAGEETPFLDLDDAAFAAQVIGATLDRVAMLQSVLPRLGPSASIVAVGSDAHLGRWHGTGQAAASAALVGIVRSVAMEYARRGVRANMIALPLGTEACDGGLVRDAARQAAALFNTESITGETILIDGGANLKMLQARRR
jgi:NAD(P)-dependent dehydrogenase (short-subunit alcohol dehydrogenase family)